MFSSRNVVTLILLIAVATLGWVGGSRFASRGETADAPGHGAEKPSAQTTAHEEKAEKGHDGHNHGAEKDEHAAEKDDQEQEAGTAHNFLLMMRTVCFARSYCTIHGEDVQTPVFSDQFSASDQFSVISFRQVTSFQL